MDSAQLSMQPVSSAEVEGRKRGLSGSTLKIIAIVIMVIDHVAAVILARQMVASGYLAAVNSGVYEEVMGWLADNKALYYSYDVMRMIGRVAFPIFCFLVVEGFLHSKNLKQYLARLGIFALIAEVPFDLAITGSVFDLTHQNVFFTLLLGLFGLCCFEYFEKVELKKAVQWVLKVAGALLLSSYVTFTLANLAGLKDVPTVLIALLVVAAVLVVAACVYEKNKGALKTQELCGDLTVLMLTMYLADLLYTDYSGMGVATIAVMYVCRKQNKYRYKLAMAMGCFVLLLMSSSELTAFFALIPIAFYNGKRGWKIKYFFYAFYPVHLLLLYLISVLMGIGGLALV